MTAKQPQTSQCTAQVVLNASVAATQYCTIRTLLGIDQKILSIRREPMLSVFSHSKCSGLTKGHIGFSFLTISVRSSPISLLI